MKTEDYLILGGAGLLAYFLLFKSKEVGMGAGAAAVNLITGTVEGGFRAAYQPIITAAETGKPPYDPANTDWLHQIDYQLGRLFGFYRG